MYINFKALKEKGIPNWMFLSIIQANQNKTEDLSSELESLLPGLTEDKLDFWLGFNTFTGGSHLFTLVKAKSKKQNIYERIRLSDYGKELLEELTTPSVEEQDKKVVDYLITIYSKAKKDVSGKARMYRHVRDFRIQSGIQKNNLIRLCHDFLIQNEEQSHKLEYIFFKPANAFDTRFRLEDSWVYKHYLKNKERLDAKFEQY